MIIKRFPAGKWITFIAGKAEKIYLFYITLCANNDPTKFPDKYFGEYQNLVLANTGDTGYVKIKVVLEKDIPFGSNGFFKD